MPRQLYIDVYEDKLKIPEPQTMPLTNIALKKAQADLESFALATNDARAKRMYTEAAKRIQQVIDQVGPYLTR
ncbi:hypothetical protein GCM10025858_26320 [Alicyclobacillus sacchari]|nr:hypothetical protein GCM10025858_26320 [Alicyclobacillus sacchari]